ncbi:nuclear factor of activated T-cells, cytoplasmic 3 isoform X2 [Paramormyrops kingsleyae]|uniref:nuclear factor of activated T-cells, cytoplasmic 3 isoform X2 n=1 Tax=Paramormyrops kingsleyae TaxID=1676925 RepID=UPI000CD610B5|nr:nuclear factor of activated T-cells, cytoplasmic 3 isoform X2 [Paramormyrops kingsleyae]
MNDLESDENGSFYIFNVGQPPSLVNQPIGIPRHGPQSHSPVVSVPPRSHAYKGYEFSYDVPRYSPTGVSKAFECPSIQITSISPSCQQGMEASGGHLVTGDAEAEDTDRPLSRGHLYLPLETSFRDLPMSSSPCSSLSSRSWFSDASSCESFSHVYDDVDSELNEAAARFTLGSPLTSPGCSPLGGPAEEPWQRARAALCSQLSPRQSPGHSPGHSPRASVTDENWLSPRPSSRPSSRPPSRPASPCGKRRHSSADLCRPGSASPHHSPGPTPGHSPRGSVTEDTWVGSPSLGMSLPFQCCPSEADIPSKTRKTSQDRVSLPGKCDLGLEDPSCMSPALDSPVEDTLKKETLGEQFLSVPSHFTWNKPKPGHTPIFRASSLPPLDWPLPSQFGQYELKIEVQPKAHHRAHYETEGSRGAVKAASGGHPVVKLTGFNEKPVNLQMFIGTADDRYLRPHAFYQVHRITGKTVATASQEIIIASTKLLEIPLLPDNNMSASIDCAGILKLRNSDIELRKGETDIGRKNTRVRVVFRVHVPQASGKVLSLQVASIPVECSQRSAQELPQVDKCSLNSCPISGGEEMVIMGSNFFPESKVIFQEKGPEGRPQWEVEAKVVRERSHGSSLVLEVPPYHNKAASSPVQVQFFVCNGKRKRSQCQRFTYLSVVKQEHRDEMDLPVGPPAALSQAHHLARPRQPSPDSLQPHDSLLSGSPQSLVAGLPAPQQVYPHLGAPSFQQLSPLEAHGLGPDCQMVGAALGYTTAPPPPCPAYQSIPCALRYNGQPSLPMTTTSPQAYEPITTYQLDPATSHPLNLGVLYHSSLGTASSSVPPGPLTHGSSHLHSLGFPCPNPGQAPCPSYPNTASCPSSATAPPPTVPSPHSGPSSPQLPPLPYQSPNGGSASSPSPTSSSPLMHLPCSGQASPQASSPGMGSLASAGALCPPLTPRSPFSPEGERLHIKQEPEDKELTFQSIGLQDITLDDVNEIIGRDMSQTPGLAAAHSQP